MWPKQDIDVGLVTSLIRDINPKCDESKKNKFVFFFTFQKINI